MDKLPYKEEILEDDGTVIKLCEQAALRIELVRLIKKYDERKELRDRMREKLTQLCNSENLGAEDRRRMPDFDLSDIHTDMRHTLDRMREGCQHLMHESMAALLPFIVDLPLHLQ